MNRRAAAMAVVMVATGALVADRPQLAAALENRAPYEPWPTCSTAAEEFCVETLEFKAPGEPTEVIADPGNPTTGDLFVSFRDQRLPDSEPEDLIPLTFDILDPMSPSFGMSGTIDGLAEGSYRIKVRIGDYPPTIFRSEGFVEDYTATQGDDGYWTIDATMTPAVWATPEGSMSGACRPMFWSDSCESSMAATRRRLGGLVLDIPQVPVPPGGVWIATNAFGFAYPQIDFEQRTLSAQAVGAHFLPDDYADDCETAGLVSEDGRCLTPAHYLVNVTYRTIALVMNMPVEVVKAYITGDALKAEVEGNPVHNFDVFPGEDGVTVDFRIRHYSAPNPKLQFKALKTLKLGTAQPRSNFAPVPNGTRLTDIEVTKQTRPGLCRLVDGKVRAADSGKKGFCVLRWKLKRNSTGAVVTKKTAIRVIR